LNNREVITYSSALFQSHVARVSQGSLKTHRIDGEALGVRKLACALFKLSIYPRSIPIK
jgi:hypothetical protein